MCLLRTTRMKVAILGSGSVGKALQKTFSRSGLTVALGARKTEGLDAGITVMGLKQAVEWGTVIFIALPAHVSLDVAKELQASLKGKVVVDCTNPLKFDANGPVWDAPARGSITAELVAILPQSHIVKAFNTFGAIHMEKPALTGSPTDVFLAGDDAEAKKAVTEICAKTGFRFTDAGPLRNAAVLENVAMLWIHLAVKGGNGPEFTIGTLPV